MKIVYRNDYNDYTNYITFVQTKLKYAEYLISCVFIFILISAYIDWFNDKLTNIHIILISFAAGIPLIIFLCFHKIYGLISIKKLNSFVSLNNLLSTKKLEIKEKEIIFTFSNDKISKFEFKDIKNILQFKNYICILSSDVNSLIFTPIIPNSAFENEEAKKEFIELLSKK